MAGKRTLVSHSIDDGVLVVQVEGPAEIPALTRYAVQHQELWAAHSRLMWDLRASDLSPISSRDLRNIRHAFAEITRLRAGARSAWLVHPDALELAESVIAINDAKHGASPVDARAFDDRRAALAWLQDC